MASKWLTIKKTEVHERNPLEKVKNMQFPCTVYCFMVTINLMVSPQYRNSAKHMSPLNYTKIIIIKRA